MIVDHTAAVFDTDFTNHICETNLDIKKIVEILYKLLETMGLQGIMHPLVYEKELIDPSDCARKLFEENIIMVPSFDEIFQQNSDKKTYYCDVLIPHLYKQMNGKTLPNGWDVLNDWIAKQNLGEIHSISMCLICECGIFLSDDSDAKILRNLIHEQMPNSIKIYNRAEIMDEFGKAAGISRSERKSIAHKRM